jgi:hypothetical protein
VKVSHPHSVMQRFVAHAAIAPQQVAVDGGDARPWAVWLCRLGSYRTFWLAHPLARCTRVASPSRQTASPDAAISTSSARRSSRLVTKLPSGWQNPRSPSGRAAGPGCRRPRSWRSRPPGRRAGTTARPAAPRRPRPGGPPATAAGCRPGRAAGMAPGGPGERPASQRGCGQRRTRAVCQRGPDLQAGFRHLADGLVPVNVRTHRASRTPRRVDQLRAIRAGGKTRAGALPLAL